MVGNGTLPIQLLTVGPSHPWLMLMCVHMCVCVAVYVCTCVCMYVRVHVRVGTIIDEFLSLVCIVSREQWGRSANERRRVDALGVRGRERHRGDRNLWWPPNLIVQGLRVYGVMYHNLFH